jgi:hypothetical protein
VIVLLLMILFLLQVHQMSKIKQFDDLSVLL